MTAPITTFNGVASGIDTKALVDSIIAADRIPAGRMEAQVRLLGTRKTAWGTYRGLISELATAAKALRTGTPFGARTVAVSGTGAGGRPLVNASVSSASPGTYRVEVEALARAGSGSTMAQPDATGPIIPDSGTSATFSLNGQTITLDAASNSLNGLRDAVNNANAGVSAYIVQTGAGAALVLKAASTGANGLQFSETSGTGTLAALGWTADAGSDATVVVDGVRVTRASNSINDIVPGLTLNLLAAEDDTVVDVTVSPDDNAPKTAVQAFVTAYNKLADFVREQTPTGATNAARPPLASETSLSSQVRSITRALQETFAAGTATANTLSQAGLKLGRDGKIIFDAAAYDRTKAAAGETGLRALFGDRLGAVADLADQITQVSSGPVAIQQQSIDRQVERLNNRVAAIDSRLERRREALTRQFVAMEAALSRINGVASAVSGQLATLAKG
jgi:flagellar hook-associated protein 2